MEQFEIKKQWEKAASGWAKWEEIFARWIKPATEAMFNMAGVVSGAKVLDLACGAGNQTLIAARRVGAQGSVVACDISETMLQYLHKNAQAVQLNNISTILSPAEELDVPPESFDAVICSLGLMLFAEPGKALISVKNTLKPGGKVAVIVFTTPPANAFMAKPMEVLLRHAGKKTPAPGKPGIFSLGAPGVIERLLTESGFVDFKKHIFSIPLYMNSAEEALQMMQEAAGAYRAVVSDCPEEVRKAAWSEVGEVMKDFETENGFNASGEVAVVVGLKPFI